MGRRALRKIDPALDLSRHLKTWDELPRPWDASLLFGREAPLEVEVGSGKGLFLQSAAVALPEHNFLGIEIAHKYARFAAARLAKHALPNAIVVDGDAQRLFTELFPDDATGRGARLFPRPVVEKAAPQTPRHERTICAGCGADARARRHAPLLDRCPRLLRRHAGSHRDRKRSWPARSTFQSDSAEHDLDYRTHFERRMRLSGEPVYRAEFHKEFSSSNELQPRDDPTPAP